MRFIKGIIFTLSIILICFQSAKAGYINVIYPKPNSSIPAVDSTFIFGNTIPHSQLYINGILTPVYKNGAFLAFIDVETGDFTFELLDIDGSDTTTLMLPIKIGWTREKFNSDSLYIKSNSILPTADALLPPNEIIELGFRGTPNRYAYYRLEGSSIWLPLYESKQIKEESSEEVFGDIPKEKTTFLSTYRNYIQISNIADSTQKSIEYKLVDTIGDSVVMKSNGKISILKNNIRVVEFTGRAEIVRTKPYAGYLLLYQQPGIRAIYDGYEDNFVRLRLSPSITGFVPEDSVSILPEGTPLPISKIRFIKIESFSKETVINIPLSCKLPFRIEQEVNPSRINILIYGGIGDTDWIKYIPDRGIVKVAYWSQVEDNLFKLTLELKGKYQWGYSTGYNENTFYLKIKKKPKYGGLLKSPVNGLRIVIDPGHCPDAGAVGPTGLTEREVNLWIAHKLRKLLESKGAKVIQTRYGYEPVAIYDRPKIAKNFGADILISIHNNALPDGVNPFTDNGVSTYYYHPQSKALAEDIQKCLTEEIKLPDFGVYYGNLALTRPSEMLSVLVECAFIMIPEQESQLKTREFQNKCAKGIYEGICDFLKEAGGN